MTDIPVSADEALHSLWSAAGRRLPGKNSADAWHWQVYHLSRYGRGMEEALSFLYNHRPDYKKFWQWLEITAPANTEAADAGPVLSPAGLEAWDANGYIVVENAVPLEACAAARTAIWEFLKAEPNDAAGWYRAHEGKKGMMLDFFQHPALDAIRRSGKIKRIYQELYASGDIYLLIDKVSFNPPETADHRFMGSALHWDVSLQLPIPYQLQGFVYLNDVSADDGAFHCVPGFHRQIEEWMSSLPEGTDARQAAVRELDPIPVPGKAGDLVVWHQALPHCATPNKGDVPRLVQYVAYKPIQSIAQDVWK